MTPSEIAAWREGVNAAAVKARETARRMRGYVAKDPLGPRGEKHIMTLETLSHANLLEQFADSLAEMAVRTEPTGLEYRGG
jgi:aromatic ring hydroxylase